MNRSLNIQLLPFLKSASLKRGAIFGSILISALLSFELFNFGTTSFALQDVLGNLKFAGFQWSTILAFAFCGIDFAGIARIFTPEQGRDEDVANARPVGRVQSIYTGALPQGENYRTDAKTAVPASAVGSVPVTVGAANVDRFIEERAAAQNARPIVIT